MSGDFWTKWCTVFLEDDGSLPEVRLTSVSPASVSAIFASLKAAALSLADTALWLVEDERSVSLSEVADPGALVARGEVQFFHSVLRDVRVGTSLLPELGVFVAQDEVSLDWRGGPDWSRTTFLALLDLLCELTRIAPEARVTTEPFVLPEYQSAFEAAFTQHCPSRAA